MTRKEQLIRQLEVLLGDRAVAGVHTPWDDVAASLGVMPVSALSALHYRIDRAIAEAYHEGESIGSKPSAEFVAKKPLTTDERHERRRIRL